MSRVFKSSTFWFLLILLVAAFLRLYRLPEYVQFLGDEGRDALIVKRMIIDHQWTLLGPTASVGGFYIGPLYYYFILPFLWLFNLDPVGPTYMSVLFGLGTIVILFLFTKELFNQKAALIAALLMALSPKMTYISRFSWNPNPVPFFILLASYFLLLATKKNSARYVFLASVCVGIMQELHYINLAFIPILLLTVILLFPKVTKLTIYLPLVISGLVLGNSLFLIFEFRHGFPNTRSVWEFMTRGGHTVAPRSFNPLWLFDDIQRRVYEIVLGFRGPVLNLFYYLSTGGLLFSLVRMLRNPQHRQKAIVLALWLVFGTYAVGFYQGQLLDHYFIFLYPLPFLALGVAGSYLTGKKIFWPILFFSLAAIVYLEIKSMYFWQPPNNLLDQTKAVDKIVLEMSQGQSYNLALLTLGNSDHAYRYFLEIWSKPPTTIENPQKDPERKSVTDQLIVVCEGMDCRPLGNPLWEVAGFGRGEIVNRRIGPAGIIIYKLLHYTGT